MAQQVKVYLSDDFDGSEATETVRFGLDGRQYEIDLSSKRAAELRDAIRPYAEKGRRATKQTEYRSSKSKPRNPRTKKIRAWAKENGYEVSERGRITQDIVDAYEKATKVS